MIADGAHARAREDAIEKLTAPFRNGAALAGISWTPDRCAYETRVIAEIVEAYGQAVERETREKAERELEQVRRVLNTDLKLASERVLTLELEVQRVGRETREQCVPYMQHKLDCYLSGIDIDGSRYRVVKGGKCTCGLAAAICGEGA